MESISDPIFDRTLVGMQPLAAFPETIPTAVIIPLLWFGDVATVIFLDRPDYWHAGLSSGDFRHVSCHGQPAYH